MNRMQGICKYSLLINMNVGYFLSSRLLYLIADTLQLIPFFKYYELNKLQAKLQLSQQK